MMKKGEGLLEKMDSRFRGNDDFHKLSTRENEDGFHKSSTRENGDDFRQSPVFLCHSQVSPRHSQVPRRHSRESGNPQTAAPVSPKKHFSQNFLKDKYIIERIVFAMRLTPEDDLVEIGPGMGALTFALPKVHSLEVIEIDREAIAYLQSHRPELVIHHADVLKFDFAQFSHPVRIIGNLPYHISTPILFHVLEAVPKIIDMHFMLQKEVVDRMAAIENEEAYGRLSVMIQYYCKVEKLLEVPPEAFHPRPSVDSAIVRLTPHRVLPHLANDPAKFSKIVAQAFSQRRKMLRRSLKGLVSPAAFLAAGVDANDRPENLSVAKFVDLANAENF